MKNFNPSKYDLIIKCKKTRTSIYLPDEDIRSSYLTKRIAKVENEKLLFTIGETSHGKDVNLSNQIKSIISESGLYPITEPTTKGNSKKEKIYVGIDLNETSTSLIDDIFPKIINTVKECA